MWPTSAEVMIYESGGSLKQIICCHEPQGKRQRKAKLQITMCVHADVSLCNNGHVLSKI